MFSFFVEMMTEILNSLYIFTHNYGVAIIILTILVKIILHPLTKKQFESMKEMQKLQPYLKGLQEKYKGKPQELHKEMLALYKQHKINPLGGCLPLLVQMPILILLYSTITSFKNQFITGSFLWSGNAGNIPIKLFWDTGFLWMPSLMIPDVPLLLLYSLSMFLSQKLTILPTPDPQQQQMQNFMAIWMPVFLTYVLMTLPSAFILYWLIFNILTTTQQIILMPPPFLLKYKTKDKK